MRCRYGISQSDNALIEFRGATRDELDGQIDYTDRGPVWINPYRVSCVYDHTILIDGHKIRVMETTDEIMDVITRGLYSHAKRKLDLEKAVTLDG